MQSKNAVTIVHVMGDMHGMCVSWNTDVGRVLKYSTLYTDVGRVLKYSTLLPV